MCIAIVKTKEGTITDEQLKNCFTRNKDGAGFAYPKDGEVVIEKGFFNFDAFLKRYREVEKDCDNNMLIHFRISTAGLVDKTNCHPHRINNKLVMIHNGVLHIDVPKNSKVSDTVLYCKRYLKQLPKGFTHNDVIMEFMAEHIGDYNKFCFLDSTGYYRIVNEDAGDWVDGVWYSNGSYKAPTYVDPWKGYSAYKDRPWMGHWYDYDYDDYDNYEDTQQKEIYGYGKVKKAEEFMHLTEAERTEILANADFYDDVWDYIDRRADNLYNEGDYNNFITLGDDPQVMLLSGRLVGKGLGYDLSCTIKLSELDKEMYDTYMMYYKEAEDMALAELNGTEKN